MPEPLNPSEPNALATYLDAQRWAGAMASAESLVTALGIEPEMLERWLRGPLRVSCLIAPDLERLTGGWVMCETSCPEKVWIRVPVPGWRNGKPLMDISSHGDARKGMAEALRQARATANYHADDVPAAAGEPRDLFIAAALHALLSAGAASHSKEAMNDAPALAVSYADRTMRERGE